MKLLPYICCVVLTSSAVNAEVPAAKLEAAKELMAVMRVNEQAEAGFEAMMPVIEQQAAQLRLTAEQKTEFMEIYRSWFRQDIDHAAIALKSAEIYAEEFSEEELKELAIFYKTPLGKKTLDKLPVITQKAAKLGMMEAQKKQHLLMAKIKPFLDRVKKK